MNDSIIILVVLLYTKYLGKDSLTRNYLTLPYSLRYPKVKDIFLLSCDSLSVYRKRKIKLLSVSIPVFRSLASPGLHND